MPELDDDQIIDADKVHVSIDQGGVLADVHQRRIARPSTEPPAEPDATHNLTRNGGGLDRTEGYSMDRYVDESAGQRTEPRATDLPLPTLNPQVQGSNPWASPRRSRALSSRPLNRPDKETPAFPVQPVSCPQSQLHYADWPITLMT